MDVSLPREKNVTAVVCHIFASREIVIPSLIGRSCSTVNVPVIKTNSLLFAIQHNRNFILFIIVPYKSGNLQVFYSVSDTGIMLLSLRSWYMTSSTITFTSNDFEIFVSFKISVAFP